MRSCSRVGRRTPMFLTISDNWTPVFGEPYVPAHFWEHISNNARSEHGRAILFKNLAAAVIHSVTSTSAVFEVLSSGYKSLGVVPWGAFWDCSYASVITFLRKVDPVQAFLSLEEYLNCHVTNPGYYFYKNEEYLLKKNLGLETIPDTVSEPVLGYKGVRFNLRSIKGDKTYTLGQWEEMKIPIVMCRDGFHFSKRLTDAKLWAQEANRFFLVEASGRVYDSFDKTKSVASKIRLVRELRPEEIKTILAKEKGVKNE